MNIEFPEAPVGLEQHQVQAHHARLVASIRASLASSDEPFLLDPRIHIENFIHRAAWMQGIHPGMILVALARERGLLSSSNGPANQRDWERAAGVVGQQTPGTVSTLWDGLPTQILMCARSTAWLGGIGPSANFGYRAGLWPNAQRWRGIPTQVRLLNLDGSFARMQECKTAWEHISWTYTPNVTKDMPAENAKLEAKHVTPFFV